MITDPRRIAKTSIMTRLRRTRMSKGTIYFNEL